MIRQRWDHLNNPNENCLADMMCPECGSLGSFWITVPVQVEVSDDGTSVDEIPQHYEWDADADCVCRECSHSASVADFLTGQPALEHWRKFYVDCHDGGEDAIAKLERDIKVVTTSTSTIFVYQWSRDCDNCEGDSVDEIPASLVAFMRCYYSFLDGLEGPGRMEIITELDAKEFVAEFRDRNAERAGY